MARRKVEEIVEEIALPIVSNNSYELVDVEFVKEGAGWYLRIYIDKPNGITLDDCQIVSEQISKKLDELDPIEQSYFLEVSSPGLDRPLKKEKDFEKYKGIQVEVKLYTPIEDKKIFEGELIGLKGHKICINHDEKGPLEFDRDKVATVKRVIKF